MSKRKLVLLRAKLRDVYNELDENLAWLIDGNDKRMYAVRSSLSLIKLHKQIALLHEEIIKTIHKLQDKG